MTRSVVTDHVATIRSRAAVVVANIVGITPDDYQEKGKAS
jgi:hypothetical protein